MTHTNYYDIQPTQYQADENPMNLEGFAFIEYCTPEPTALKKQFSQMGFTATQQYPGKEIYRYQQGSINYILNIEQHSHAAEFAKLHGPCACAMGFKVKDAQYAFERACSLGAKAYTDEGKKLPFPAIYGIGESIIYFVDDNNSAAFHRTMEATGKQADQNPLPGLEYIDHLTHNVNRGNMDIWANFYKYLFNFKQIRFFDISGKMTGLISRAMASPCGKIKIPLNESKDDNSQIEEFIDRFNGEGIQHIALYTDRIYDTVETLQESGIKFLYTPDTYYEMLPERVQGHQEDLARMQKNRILIDGNGSTDEGILLQIFTEEMLGPVFFEIIQRKGNQGFGEGNFQALFNAIELDQIRRGVLKEQTVEV